MTFFGTVFAFSLFFASVLIYLAHTHSDTHSLFLSLSLSLSLSLLLVQLWWRRILNVRAFHRGPAAPSRKSLAGLSASTLSQLQRMKIRNVYGGVCVCVWCPCVWYVCVCVCEGSESENVGVCMCCFSLASTYLKVP